MEISSVLIKPAGPDCNLSCGYCFYRKKAAIFPEDHTHRMSDALLEELTRQIAAYGGRQLAFSWQGGEPTLMGLAFFKKAIELQKKYCSGKIVSNGLQTNGILINREWLAFLSEYKFLVGLSIDGPEFIHDHYRHGSAGEKSWAKAVDSAKALLSAGVEVNAVSVVNNHSVLFAREIYEFHKTVGLAYMQFIPCLDDAEHMPQARAYGKFLCDLFDLWTADFKNGAPTTSVRFFDAVFYNFVGLPAPQCTLLPECGNYLVVEHNGDAFSCDFFVEPKWKLGNIKKKSLSEMFNSQMQNEFGKLKAAMPEECRICEWLKYCFGGCTKERSQSQENKNISYFCESYKMFFEHAGGWLKQFAENWKNRQTWEQ